ncbi:hypothetical protein chiPu_0031011, partial [Chiloscyllium punctatum]|nr:hypothetical protein [Chiloscyllium punctatum]
MGLGRRRCWVVLAERVIWDGVRGGCVLGQGWGEGSESDGVGEVAVLDGVWEG